jgi:hypothetical protein
VPTYPLDLAIFYDTLRGMFLRAKPRFKDGKEHRYWSIVENHRTVSNKVVQRQVLYLGEINDGQKASWVKTIDVVENHSGRVRQIERIGASSAATVGGLLAGLPTVERAGSGSVLDPQTPAQSQGDTLAQYPENPGLLPADFPRERMAVAQAVV